MAKKYGEVESLLKESLSIEREMLGNEHPEVATTLNNLGTFYRAQGNLDDALNSLLEAASISEKFKGADHSDTITMRTNIAGILKDQGAYEESENLYRDCLERIRRTTGGSNRQSINIINNLGDLYLANGKYEEAELCLQEESACVEDVLGASHPQTAMFLNNLGRAQIGLGRWGDASATLVSAILHAQTKPDLANISSIESRLGECYSKLGFLEVGEELLVQSYETLARNRSLSDRQTRNALQRLILHYDSHDLCEKADEHRGLLPETD